MKNLRNISLVGVLLIAVTTSCGPATVTRIGSSQTTDLSGRWNDTDARLVAETMIQDMVARPWRARFMDKHQKEPVLVVGVILNKSHEHINPEAFIKDIEREFINTGVIRIVTHSAFREKLRQERQEQQEFASAETQKKLGAELGADFMLSGTITSIVDTQGKDKVIFYQINLELADLETGEVQWIGDKKIKKYVGKGRKIKKRYQGK